MGSRKGDGTRNAQYYCFGQPILAPGAGKAVVVVDGLEDNVPGKMDREHPAGNHVVLDHGNGEFSFLAHFTKGIQVGEGADVASGAVLGKCGNSGNSSEPHLHYHLQSTPVFREGEGLPAQFLEYVADGKEVARGEPTRGQTIRRK
jgi:murein DD-endopeptidase MepM/ murein hydrolase activator NlpD